MISIRRPWWAALAISALTVGCAGENAVDSTNSSPAASPSGTPAVTPSGAASGTSTSGASKGGMSADMTPDSTKGAAGAADKKDEGPAPVIEAPPKIEAPPRSDAGKKDEAGKKDDAAKVVSVKLTEDEVAEIKKLPAGEQDSALKQAVCPVSGKNLGSMETPVKVSAEGKTFYLCCGGCKKKVAADPKAVLAKLNSNAKAR